MKYAEISKTHVKLLGVKYKRTTPASLTGEDGEFHCPVCGNKDVLNFIHEDIQHGFWFNLYYEFLECIECGAHVVSVVRRKADDYVNV